MIRLFRLLRLKRELDRSLSFRKQEHQRRSEASKRGEHTRIANLSAQTARLRAEGKL